MNEGLESLRQARQRWVDVTRENDFEEGIKRVLTELYPDNAHFIYELLQNAEDTGARTVRFTLGPDELQFEHNGTRLFNHADVASITNIGNSIKRNDPTSVGKFGVGFKAVFAYTATPEVHSGTYQFRIRDLVVPDASGVTKTALGEQNTRFVFPFDHATKRPARAATEIGGALRALDASSLLFLDHIHAIEYLLPDGALGSVERNECDDHTVEIHHCAPDGSETSTAWLRFSKGVEIPLEAGGSKSCRVAVAYALRRAEGDKAGAEWSIAPAEPGRVCIYFPAAKETSNLRFHLHAPFASTVARDTVRDCAENELLRDALAELVVESLEAIRRKGMMTVEFLGVLPNPDDGLAEFYEPIRGRIVQAFRERPLLPTRSGSHAAAATLYQGPAKIAEVLSDDDLAQLTARKPPLWAANAPQQNQRPSRFLDSLGLHQWGWSELIGAVNSWDKNVQATIERLVQGKADDRWVQRFYALLGEACELHHTLLFNAQCLRIVRVDGDQHVLPAEAYFTPGTDSPAPTDVRFVKRAAYENKRSRQQSHFAVSFLQSAGVRPFDEAEATKRLLAKYDGEERVKEVTDHQHYRDMRTLVAAWKKRILSPADYANSLFILGTNAVNDERYWCKPCALVLDSPYEPTDLLKFYGVHRKQCVIGEYAEKLPKNSRDDFVQFLGAVGVMRALAVTATSTNNNPAREQLMSDYFRYETRRTSSAIDEDFTIIGMHEYVRLKSREAGRLLWNALIGADKRCAKARFRPNRQYPTREADSQVVHYLKNVPWVPDAAGNFRKPCDTSRSALPEGFDYDDRNGMLTAIEFGERARERDTAYRARTESARGLGFGSAEEAQQVAEILRQPGVSVERLRALVQAQKAVPLPEAKVPQPARRSTKVMESAAHAPDKESVSRERSVDPNAQGSILEARAYLRAKYTNSDGQLVCQCCHAEMPFKVRGEYYFEAVQCVRNLDKHYFQNRLALCPTCAAKYQHARETTDEQISTEVRTVDLADDVASASVQMRLAGVGYSLYFVGSHWFDLKTLLTNEPKVARQSGRGTALPTPG